MATITTPRSVPEYREITEDEEGEGALKAYGVFKNRTIEETPCLRGSLLSSITTGLVSGTTFFMFTSNVGKSTHVGFASCIGVLFTYYTVCRYYRAKEKFEHLKIRKGLEEYTLKKGTEYLDDDDDDD